ncbi:MAG: cytochrome c oxidase subunit I [Chloroflexi bacterium]|nr:cytochrome c oxidase subunit I [Chloroflexota bacterium]
MAVRADRLAAHPAPYAGLWSWLTTVDHKRIGILYGVSALIFFVIGGLQALLMRLQLAVPDNRLVDPDTFNALFTMHGTTMVFLVIMPMSAAFFNYVVPLQIGARDVAFPRLNAFSYWAFLAGAIMLNISFLTGQVPDMGWFAYANLTGRAYSPTPAVDYWILGLQLLGVASMAAAINFFVTIVNMRAPGMTLMRMPVFTWMTLVTAVLILLAFPVITVGVTILLFDRLIGTNFFLVAKGGDPILWQHLFWVFGHPEVYILILPAMGIVSEVLPTFSRKPLFGYPFVVYSGIAIGFLSFGVWAHHMFAVGMGPIADAIFAVNTMLIAIPTGVKIFNWIGTMWGGSIRFTTAMKFAVGFIALFIIGGISGIMHAIVPLDLQHTDTYFIVAHFHYVLFGGSIMGLAAGLYYWFPKMTGRLMDERLGTWAFWITFLGFNLTFFPMHFTGLLGMPRRTYTYAANMGLTELNFLQTAGALVLGVGSLLILANVVHGMRHGRPSGRDPWDGHTLEWTIPNPPPAYNFAAIPVVHGRRPFWDAKYPAYAEHAHAPAAAPAQHPVATAEAHAEEHIHMPNPSYYPLVVAVGIFIVMTGVLIYLSTFQLVGPTLAVSAVGALVFLVGLYGWIFEPPA